MHSEFSYRILTEAGSVGGLDVIIKMDLPNVRCDVKLELTLFRVDPSGLFL